MPDQKQFDKHDIINDADSDRWDDYRFDYENLPRQDGNLYHICLIYSTEVQWEVSLVPFIRQGLENGEKCLYIADTHTLEYLCSHLKSDGFALEPYIESRRFVFFDSKESYMQKREFDSPEILARLAHHVSLAGTEGYPGIRITQEMSWSLRNPSAARMLSEYEFKINETLKPAIPCRILCQYDRPKFDAAAVGDIIGDIIRSHPLIVWHNKILRNFYYTPPQHAAGKQPVGGQVDYWLNNLWETNAKEAPMDNVDHRFKTIIQHLPIPAVYRSGETIHINAEVSRLTGYGTTELQTTEQWFRLLFPRLAQREREVYEANLKNGFPTTRIQQLTCKDGSLRDIEFSASYAMKSNDIWVISPMRELEEPAAQDTDSLLRHTHHRVKNNMAVISALLSLQGELSGDPHIQKALNNSRIRIHAVSLIHEVLHQDTQFFQVDLESYTRNLIKHLASHYRADGYDIDIKLHAQEVKLDLNNSTPCGLLMSELITNALQHAFTHSQKGTVTINILKETKIKNHEHIDFFTIEIKDDGKGLPEAVDIENPKTLGLQLVVMLCKQLGGALSVERGNGTVFRLRFSQKFRLDKLPCRH